MLKIDTRDFPKSLKYLDLSGNKIELTHWDPNDHNLEVLGLNATRIINDFDERKLVEGIKIVEKEPIAELKNRIEFEAGGEVCSYNDKQCRKITEKQIRNFLKALKENYHPYDRKITCYVDIDLANNVKIILKDRRGGDIKLVFEQTGGVFWKDWGVEYPLSYPEGNNRVMEALNIGGTGGKSCKREEMD